MDDDIEDLNARVEALRLAIGLMARLSPNPIRVTAGLMEAERHARRQNLPPAAIEELRTLRAALDE